MGHVGLSASRPRAPNARVSYDPDRAVACAAPADDDETHGNGRVTAPSDADETIAAYFANTPAW